MGFGNLLKTVRKLNRMWRWANQYMTEDVRPTVSSHTFTVAQTAQMLGVIEEKNGTPINWRNLYEKAINHDVKEAITGDILSHVKNRNKQMKALVQQIENELTEDYIFSKLPSEYVDIYRKILNNDKDETIEGQILEAADKIDALIEAIIELQRNNPEEEFFKCFIDNIRFLRDMDLYSIKYFLNNILFELIGDATELKKIAKQILKGRL